MYFPAGNVYDVTDWLTDWLTDSNKKKHIFESYPYENRSFFPHLVITVAIKPVSNAVQSKNMWNESEINPRLKWKDSN